MAETTTANNGWTMPDPGASANTWGATLNANGGMKKFALLVLLLATDQLEASSG